MTSEKKEEILNKIVKLLAVHQKVKGRHADAKDCVLTDERWLEIDKHLDRVAWLYEGRFLSNHVDKKLVTECCKMFLANEHNFTSRLRGRELVYARAFYCKILSLNGQTFNDIAAKIKRDRSNVYNMLNTADNLIETNKTLRAKFESLQEKFKDKESIDAL